jgi:hypothetical protein
MAGGALPDIDARLLTRITAARQDRGRHQAWMNDVLRFGMPTYRRVGEASTLGASSRAQDQDDLFDTTLQTVLEDFGTDMASTFTPRFEHWVKFEPDDELTEGQRRQVAGTIRQIEDTVFGEIERSNYYEAAQECFPFWGIAAMAVALSDMGPLDPLHFQPIELADLLMERGADGSVVGRWREMYLDDRQLNQLWPKIFDAPGRNHQPARRTVIDGCDRDFRTPGEENWNHRIIVDNKQRWAMRYKGAGSCPIIACRFRYQSASAWGPGPAHKAVPMARVLDELAYLNLKALQRAVDPITSYEEDGVMNLEAGLDAGTWIPRAQGSKPPEPLTPDVRFDALVWNVDQLRNGIKKAVYQDRPEQDGKTPPTLGQWNDEKVWNSRRRELPRDRCVREWVMPIIERVMYIKRMRGELPDVRLGDKLIKVRPVSPLSKAKDLEDVQVTQQVLMLAQNIAAVVQAMPAVDARATIENVKRTLRERHIVLLTDEQIQQAAEIALSKATVSDAGQAGALTA